MTTVKLYHLARDVKSAESFLTKGALPTGRGLGGQSSGFYCFQKPVEEGQVVCSYFYERDGNENSSLMVGVQVPIEQIKYPEWQIDVALSESLGVELCKWHHQIMKIGVFPAVIRGKETEICVTGLEKREVINENPTTSRTGCCLEFYIMGQEDILEATCGYGQPNNSYAYQSVVDALCEKSPSFLKSYNELLQKIVQNQTSGCVKYTGTEPLPVATMEKIYTSDLGIMSRKEQVYPEVQHSTFNDNPFKAFGQKILDKLRFQR